MRRRIIGPALAGITLALGLVSCGGDSERDTDDAGTQRGGTGGSPSGTGGGPPGSGGSGGSSGSDATSTGGYYNPCASFTPTTTTTCARPLPFAGGGAGGEAGTSDVGGAAGAGVPTLEECRQNPPYCTTPTPAAQIGISVQGGLCCVTCQTICG
jgi:hypothetical protein